MKVNKEKVKSVVKKAVVLIAASLATISLFACGGKAETKMEYPSISIDQDANLSNGNKINSKEVVTDGNFNGGNVASSVKADDMVDYVPQYADLLKDEVNWPISKWGYHEPPKSLRTYSTSKLDDNAEYKYSIPIYSEKYGNLTMNYNTKTGERYILYAKGNEPKGVAVGPLMVVDAKITKTNSELLRDLKMGDSIADNFFK